MNVHTIDLMLAAVEVPKPQRGTASTATGGGRPIFWGNRHEFLPKLKQLIRNSPTASAMLGRKAALTAGQGFKVNEEKLPTLSAFLKKVAPEGKYKTGNKLLKRVSRDYADFSGVACQAVWADDRKHIAELYFQRFETVAPGPMDEEENITEYFLCRDWSNTQRYKVQRIPAFDADRANSMDEKERAANATQLAVFFEGDEYFPDLQIQAGLNYMAAEGLLSEFHPNNISNKFSLGSILSIHNGPQDAQDPNDATRVITAAEQQRAFVSKLKKTFTGPSAEQLMVLFGDGTAADAEALAKLTSYTPGTNETLYESIAKMCQQAILSAGQVTSPEVVGLPSVGGLGGDGGKLIQSYKLYFNTVCRPAQITLIEFFKELLAYVPGVDFSEEPEDEFWLDIATTLPVDEEYSEDTQLAVCTDAEIRTRMGLPGTPPAAEKAGGAPLAQQSPEQKQLAASVGGQTSIDAMLANLAQKLTNRESCIARLKIFFGLTQDQAEEIVPADTIEVPAGSI